MPSGKYKITMEDLTKVFDTVEEDDKIFDPNWFKDMLYKLK